MTVYEILNQELQSDYDNYPLFGLLLYSDRDSTGYMGHVLKDAEFAERLDRRSTDRWLIFTLKLLTPQIRQQRHSAQPGVCPRGSSSPWYGNHRPSTEQEGDGMVRHKQARRSSVFGRFFFRSRNKRTFVLCGEDRRGVEGRCIQ